MRVSTKAIQLNSTRTFSQSLGQQHKSFFWYSIRCKPSSSHRTTLIHLFLYYDAHVNFGLPLPLYPCTSSRVNIDTLVLSTLISTLIVLYCPNHLGRFSLFLSAIEVIAHVNFDLPLLLFLVQLILIHSHF